MIPEGCSGHFPGQIQRCSNRTSAAAFATKHGQFNPLLGALGCQRISSRRQCFGGVLSVLTGLSPTLFDMEVYHRDCGVVAQPQELPDRISCRLSSAYHGSLGCRVPLLIEIDSCECSMASPMSYPASVERRRTRRQTYSYLSSRNLTAQSMRSTSTFTSPTAPT